MEKGQISKKVSPHKFEEARSSIKIVKQSSQLKAVEFRNNFEYNSGRMNNFSARLKIKIITS